MTGADRVELEDGVERTGRVEPLTEVKGEENPESRERMTEAPGLLSLRGRLLFDETRGDATASETSEDNWSR